MNAQKFATTRTSIRSTAAAGTVLAASALMSMAVPASAAAASTPCDSAVNLAYKYVDGGTLVTSHCAYAGSVSVDSKWAPGGIGDPPCTPIAASSVPDESNSVFFPDVEGAPYYC